MKSFLLRLYRAAQVLGLMFILVFSSNTAYAEVTTYTYVLKSQLILEDGTIMAGTYDVRLSLWRSSMARPDDLYVDARGNTVLNILSPEFSQYMEEQVVTSDAQGHFSVTMGADVPLFKRLVDGNIFLQVDAKPSGSDQTNWRRIDTRKNGNTERISIQLSELQQTRYRFDTTQKGYGGILLDKNGKPQKGEYVARISVWSSPNVDEKSDFLPDGTLRTSSNNYLGFTNHIFFESDEFGRFQLPFGSLLPVALKSKEIYVQIEMKGRTDSNSQYDLIDPDGDLQSAVDRFVYKDGRVTTVDTHNVARYGDDEKLLVSNMPSGTSANYFELGVGNALPKAYFEIRARQSDGKPAVLRFNSLSKLWEVSNDGVNFSPISTYINGTKSDTFTIGLHNDDAEFLTLQFGDSLQSARIMYDAAKNMFRINRSIDFEQNQLVNAVLENRSTPPDRPVAGQQYFNTVSQQALYFDGRQWVAMGGGGAINTGGPFIVPQGGVGPQGPAGPAGPQGATGAQGAVGPQGAAGASGGASIEKNVVQTYAPGYAGMVLQPLPGSGKGTMVEEQDQTNRKNFYRWATKQSGKQTMQMVVEWIVPQDFDGFQAHPFVLEYRTSHVSDPNVAIDMRVVKNGVALPITGGTQLSSTTAGVWKTSQVDLTGTPTFVAGDKLVLTFSLSAHANTSSDISSFAIQYLRK